MSSKLNNLDNSEKKQSESGNSSLISREYYSGPMPHPSIVEGYENVYHGAAEIIFNSFKQQTEHRIEIEKEVIKTGNKKEILGIWFGFVIAMTTILGGIYVYANVDNAELFGGGLSFSGLAILVGAFVFSRKGETPSNKSENQED